MQREPACVPAEHILSGVLSDLSIPDKVHFKKRET